MTAADVRKKVQALVDAAGSQNALAIRWGVAPSVLKRTLSGERDPSPTILAKLGLKKVTKVESTYVPIGGSK